MRIPREFACTLSCALLGSTVLISGCHTASPKSIWDAPIGTFSPDPSSPSATWRLLEETSRGVDHERRGIHIAEGVETAAHKWYCRDWGPLERQTVGTAVTNLMSAVNRDYVVIGRTVLLGKPVDIFMCYRLRGEVRDVSTGRIVPGFTVSCLSPCVASRVKTHRDGTFELTTLLHIQCLHADGVVFGKALFNEQVTLKVQADKYQDVIRVIDVFGDMNVCGSCVVELSPLPANDGGD